MLKAIFHNMRRRSCAVALGIASVSTATMAGPGAIHDELGHAALDVNATLSLKEHSVVSLQLNPMPGQPQLIDVDIDGQTYTLDLKPHSIRHQGYQLFTVGADGQQVEVAPGPERTLRGSVVGQPDSVVAGSLSDVGLEARIQFSNGAEFWLEPLADRLPGFAAEDHALYRTQNAIAKGSCGVGKEHHLPGPEGSFGTRMTNVCTTELACDADFEYYQDYGSSVSAVEARINSVINAMNIQYESEVGISHEITAIIVRTTSGSPYTSSNSSTLLNQFRNHWNSTQGGIVRDVAQLFTGKNLDGSVIGVAWLNAICGSFGYGVVESDFSGSFACTTDLSAHELGHNWGADHCSCSGNTMNPSITCANTFSSTDTRPDIVSFRNSVNCLDCEISGTPIPLIDYVIKKGIYVSGALADLQDSDDTYLRVLSTILNNSKQRTFTIAVFEAPASSVSQINVLVEAGHNSSNVVGQIALRDFTTQRWVRFDNSGAPAADTERFVFNAENPNRFINPDNNRIRVKIWQRRSGTANVIETRIDHVEVTIQP